MHGDAVVILNKTSQLRSVVQSDAGQPGCMAQQDGFQKNLVDAVRRLRGGPPAVWAADVAVAVTSARNRDAREFGAGHAGAKHHVVGEIGRQSGERFPCCGR